MRAEIDVNGSGRGIVRLDGHDVSMGVRGFTLSAAVGEVSRLDLELVLFEDSRLSGDVDVIVPDGTRDALITLGWTPPTTDKES